MRREKILLGERQQIILSILEKDGSVSVDDLARQLSVSGMTIRRDLGIEGIMSNFDISIIK